jgi:hypothetical protein
LDEAGGDAALPYCCSHERAQCCAAVAVLTAHVGVRQDRVAKGICNAAERGEWWGRLEVATASFGLRGAGRAVDKSTHD